MSRVGLATRGSALARWQAGEVARVLKEAHPMLTFDLLVVETSGDRRREVPIRDVGGQGVFVKEVQAAVIEGRARLAVHSAKDLPSTEATGLGIGAVLRRGDPRDALVGAPLSDLAPGAAIATGSVRRRAQLAWLRSDLTFEELRGNIPTRLQRVPAGGAAVVAAAALARLGLAERAAEVLGVEVMLPQVGQGAIAVECREDDFEMREILRSIDHSESRVALECERSFLARLGGGCDLPVGAYAQVDGDRVTIEGMLASPDGRVMLKATAESTVSLARQAGEQLATDLLGAGGAELLAG